MNILNHKDVIALFPKDDVITGKELAKILNMKYTSEVRGFVNYWRCNGIPICSNHYGYYISDNPVEIMATIKSLRGRMNSIGDCVRGMESYLYGEKKC